jgi:hypothetical protein
MLTWFIAAAAADYGVLMFSLNTVWVCGCQQQQQQQQQQQMAAAEAD